MTAWHVDDHLLARYAVGRLDLALAASLEAHVEGCAACRRAAAGHVDDARVARGLDAVLAAVDAPQPGVVETLLRWLGAPEHDARLLAATASLRLSWLLAVGLALGFALAAAHLADDPREGVAVFSAVAALLPLAGVAAAYGPGVDPAYDIGVAAPIHGWRLLLLRATAVLISTVLLAGGAALLLPDAGLAVVAWLLPSLALTLASLSLSTLMPPLRSAALVAAAWAAVVTLAAAREGQLLLGAGLQAVAAAAVVVAAVVLAARSAAFETRSAR